MAAIGRLLPGPPMRTSVPSSPVPAVPARRRGGQFLPFIAVGAGATLATITLTSVAVELAQGVPSWLVAVVCYAAMIGPAYLAHRRFAFATDARHSVALPRYAAVQVAALGLTAMFSWVCYGVGLPTPVAASIVTLATAGVNFTILRLWAFAGSR